MRLLISFAVAFCSVVLFASSASIGVQIAVGIVTSVLFALVASLAEAAYNVLSIAVESVDRAIYLSEILGYNKAGFLDQVSKVKSGNQFIYLKDKFGWGISSIVPSSNKMECARLSLYATKKNGLQVIVFNIPISIFAYAVSDNKTVEIRFCQEGKAKLQALDNDAINHGMYEVFISDGDSSKSIKLLIPPDKVYSIVNGILKDGMIPAERADVCRIYGII